jgi:two-component system, OmpR family, sensor histidine kinase QseC
LAIVFLEWARHSLQRRLLVSLLLGVGLSLAAFQIVVDRLVDRYIERSFNGPSVDLAQRDRLMREVDFILLGGVVTVLGVCALGTVLSVRRGLKPLGRVASAAQEISVDQPVRALPLSGVPAEIQPLCDRINQLIERLTEALEHERRFSADLAHELRTPLAEIRTLGEAGVARKDVAGLQEFLRQTAAAAVGMQSVIESLLAVARADRAAAQQGLEPMSVGAAVRARIERMSVTAPADCSRIVARIPQGLWVQSEPRLFDAMLLNLLANAVQHGDSRAPIEIDWLAEGSGAGGTLQVRNAAPELAREDLARLTDRFWRGRGITGRDTGASGLGLGLWVVGSLCRVLGLTLALDLDEMRRLNVRLVGFRPL